MKFLPHRAAVTKAMRSATATPSSPRASAVPAGGEGIGAARTGRSMNLTFTERVAVTRRHPGHAFVIPVAIIGDHHAAAVHHSGTTDWGGACTCGWEHRTVGMSAAQDAAADHLGGDAV